jgi:hypothetical protein
MSLCRTRQILSGKLYNLEVMLVRSPIPKKYLSPCYFSRCLLKNPRFMGNFRRLLTFLPSALLIRPLISARTILTPTCTKLKRVNFGKIFILSDFNWLCTQSITYNWLAQILRGIVHQYILTRSSWSYITIYSMYKNKNIQIHKPIFCFNAADIQTVSMYNLGKWAGTWLCEENCNLDWYYSASAEFYPHNQGGSITWPSAIILYHFCQTCRRPCYYPSHHLLPCERLGYCVEFMKNVTSAVLLYPGVLIDFERGQKPKHQ